LIFRRRIAIVVLVGAVSAACSSSSEKLTKEIQEANSWIASAQIVAKSYGDGAVPKAYAHDALNGFNQQLRSTAKRVQSMSDPRVPETVASLQRVQQAISQIEASIEQADQLSLAQFAVQLQNEQRQLTLLLNPGSTPTRHP